MKEGVQEKNSHNRPDSTDGISTVGDGRAVEYYFASDARWELYCVCVCFVLNPTLRHTYFTIFIVTYLFLLIASTSIKTSLSLL